MDDFEFLKDVDLKDYCTIKVGGKANFLFIAHNTQSLIDVCIYCKTHNIKYKIIGMGANLIFDDLGYNGLIIVNKTNNILFRGECVYVDSGVNLTSLIMKCVKRNLCGFESLAGIPASVGGAVTNSVSAYECNLTNHVEYVECYHKNDLNKKLKIKKDDCNFSYRSSLFRLGDYVITHVKFNLNKDDKNEIIARMNDALNKKSSAQPLDTLNAGSTFKRGNLIPAKVIDELGLKGLKIGDAQVSTKHAGFIINTGSATSKDIKELVKYIQTKVLEAYREKIEPEIEFVPFE